MITSLKNNELLENFLNACRQRVNTFMLSILPDKHQTPTQLHEAMHYAVLNGGKRIRPSLVYAVGEFLESDPSVLDYPAAAVEFIHAYSLVHDDLPAMDDDDLRRGQLTCHKAYNEGIAILVGDALQSLAFKVLSEAPLSNSSKIAMVSCLAQASGSRGMAGGQALDLSATGKRLNLDQLNEMHRLKTGALINASVQLAYLSKETINPIIHKALTTFADYLGLIFQIQDDILDEEGFTSTLGKQSGSDQDKQKATYVTIQGISAAKNSLQVYYKAAINALESTGKDISVLKSLTDFIILRDH